MTRRLLALTTALFALSATSASAATICVPTGTGCDHTSPDLPAAISLAATTPAVRDTIRLTAGDFTQNAVVGATNPVDIVGAGQGTGGTILRSPNNSFALDIQSPGSTVSNLRVRVENQPALAFESGIALSASGAVANGITVLGEPGVDNAVGVIVRTGAILRNSLVQVPPTNNANNAIGAEEGTLIENVSAAGDRMVDARDLGPPVVIRRLRSSTPSPIGIQAIGGGSVNVSDALIRLSGGSIGGGLYAETTASGSPAIVARHVTVVGTGDSVNAGRGVYADGFDPGRTATIDVRDSIFHALSTDLEVEANAGIARILIGYSDYNPAKVVDTSAGDAAVVAGAGNLLANPGFVDGAAADFRLRADSPLLDRGFSGAGSTADLDGRPRPNDGNGDGVAVRDPGAFEYQRPASPPAVTDTSAPLFRILSRRLKLNRRGRVAMVLRGPANETAMSNGSLGLRSVRGRRALGRKSFSLRPSARTVVTLKLTRKRARRVRRLGKLRVILSVTVRDGAGNARTVRKRVMLRALRARN
jgi:hypothetical protein